MKENINNVEYASLLYDFYGDLLDENRRLVMDLYHEDNLSLAEIAKELGMSRQGVHYTLKKAESALERYEEKLGLVSRYFKDLKRVERAGEIAERMRERGCLDERDARDVSELVGIIKDIVE